MAFERNDIVNKTRLMGELGEEIMGFEHNDIVTVDVMNEAIEEGGGGGGGDYKTANVTIIGDNGGEAWSFSIYASQDDDGLALCAFDIDGNFALNLNTDGAPTTAKVVYTGEGALVYPYNVFGSATGDAVYDGDTNTITITGDCTITGYMND